MSAFGDISTHAISLYLKNETTLLEQLTLYTTVLTRTLTLWMHRRQAFTEWLLHSNRSPHGIELGYSLSCSILAFACKERPFHSKHFQKHCDCPLNRASSISYQYLHPLFVLHSNSRSFLRVLCCTLSHCTGVRPFSYSHVREAAHLTSLLDAHDAWKPTVSLLGFWRRRDDANTWSLRDLTFSWSMAWHSLVEQMGQFFSV